MTIFLPKSGYSASDIIKRLNAVGFENIENSMTGNTSLVELSLPKSKHELEMALNDVLKTMGIREAFDPVRRQIFLELRLLTQAQDSLLIKCAKNPWWKRTKKELGLQLSLAFLPVPWGAL